MEIRCVVHSTNKTGKQVEFIESQTEWGGKWDRDTIYYEVIGECRTMTKKQVRNALNSAMTTWDIEIPITFKPYWYGAPVDKPDITVDFKNSREDQTFKDTPSVLAYAYFPAQGTYSGKIVFNNDYIWDKRGFGIKAKDALAKGWITSTNNPENIVRTYSVIAVLIHELGHSLGLKHDVSGNSDGVDVMDAFYSGSDRFELSVRDIYRIVSKYGNRIYSRWSAYAKLKKAIARAKLRP